MDKIIKLTSRQGGPFNQQQNLCDFDIPADGTYDLSDSYIDLFARVSGTSGATTLPNLPSNDQRTASFANLAVNWKDADPFATPKVNSLTNANSSLAYAPSHFHLPDGNPWSQTVGSLTENFYSDNVGYATYRRVSSGGWTHYWRQTGLGTWDIYFTLPTASSVRDNTAEIDPVTHIISFSNTGTTFVPNTLLSTVDSDTLLGSQPPSQNRLKSIHSFTFGSRLLSDFLRFADLQYTQYVQFAKFAAESMFDITDTADSFVVEMLSLELESYDSKTEGRRSILATVPKTESVDGTIVYEANYPTFINVRNRNPVALRNMRLRILKSDLTPILITGTATLTLLID